ncbi:MAG: thioredoxin domain-containing protein [Bryobacteraceae bacterium]|nr:thioredoxin domain-containing protein [Bryobacteraceae bacterium]
MKRTQTVEGKDVSARALILILVLLAAATFPVTARAAESMDPEVTIEIFSDFECPFCKSFAPVARELETKGIEGTRTKVHFKNFPLSFHRNARLAAQAAVAAAEQGKFWEMHDALFANQGALGREDLLKYAGSLKLDMTRFQQDLDSESTKKKVEADLAEGAARNVQGTPTFFVNGKLYSGAKTITELKALVQADVGRRVALAEIADTLLSKGPAGAPVTLEFFADLQSPVSRTAHYIIEELLAKYPDQVRVQFRNFPLAFHPQAAVVHDAAMTAAREGHFWRMANYIFDRQESVREQDLIAFAGTLGLDQAAFSETIRKRKYTPRVEADIADGFQRGVRGSPVIFVNGARTDGVPSLQALVEQVTGALAAQPPGASTGKATGN